MVKNRSRRSAVVKNRSRRSAVVNRKTQTQQNESFYKLLSKSPIIEKNKKKSGEKKYYLSIFAYFRDEAKYLKEWIEFHREVGVEHFYLLNNWSKDDWEGALRPYVDKGIVDVVTWNSKYCKGGAEAGSDSKHMRLKNFAFSNMDMQKETQWLAMIDVDEYLFPTSKNESLKDILKEFEEFGGVGVNRLYFGSSGHKKPPSGLIIENYIFRAIQAQGMRNVKSIANMDYFIKPDWTRAAHANEYSEGRFTVDQDKKMIPRGVKGLREPKFHRLRINHYFTGCTSDWRDRMERSSAKYVSSGGKRNIHTWKFFRDFNKKCTKKDLVIKRYKGAVKRRMKDEKK